MDRVSYIVNRRLAVQFSLPSERIKKTCNQQDIKSVAWQIWADFAIDRANSLLQNYSYDIWKYPVGCVVNISKFTNLYY